MNKVLRTLNEVLIAVGCVLFALDVAQGKTLEAIYLMLVVIFIRIGLLGGRK